MDIDDHISPPKWTCKLCTLLNSTSTQCCIACNSPKGWRYNGGNASRGRARGRANKKKAGRATQYVCPPLEPTNRCLYACNYVLYA